MDKENVRSKELGDFLKTRRAKISPAQAGIADSTTRRTPGLRREEVAQLSGISITWYTWLEQGRPIQVSAQVIESLCRVLQLDKEERFHLHRLAKLPLPIAGNADPLRINPIYQHVLDSLTLTPALIADQRWTVFSWNRPAEIIFGDFPNMDERQRNIVWGMFTNEYYKQLYVDWEPHAKSLLGKFRVDCGKFIEEPWLNEFIEELKEISPEFSKWWPLHEVQTDSGTHKQFKLPSVGKLDFESCYFDVPDHSGYRLFLHVPVPETDTADKMESLLQR